MRYQHSVEIHERLETVLRLIQTGMYSTPALASKVGVSIPTISRIVAALRERGHAIRAERNAGCWRYVIEESRASTNQRKKSHASARTDRQPGRPND